MDNEKLAGELVRIARDLTADYGDASVAINVWDIFEAADKSAYREFDNRANMKRLTDAMGDALADNIREINDLVIDSLSGTPIARELESQGIRLR